MTPWWDDFAVRMGKPARVADLGGLARRARRCPHCHPARRTPRGGFILILVLVVIAVLSLSALTYSELMFTEREAVDLAGRQVQARALAASGIEFARVLLAADQATRDALGGLADNPSLLRGVLVLDAPHARGRGRFTLLASHGPSGGVRFGLENESAKLNLNRVLQADKSTEGAGRKMLMHLPGMTEDIADAILDWIDPDDEPREFGAESEYYSTLDPPCTPRNGPIGSIEELLLVRGVTPALLFGADANRNGTIDAGESASMALDGTLAIDASMDRGWAAYLTACSREAVVTSDGKPKINVNQTDMQALYDALIETLEPSWATFIVAYRQQTEAYAPSEKDPSPKIEAEPSGELDLSVPGSLELKSLLDLIGVRVRVTYKGRSDAVILESPFANDTQAMRSYLPKLWDCVTTSAASNIPGRVNILEAPPEVLAAIPAMTDEAVDAILAQRDAAMASNEPSCRHPIWLLAQGIVTLDAMKSLEPYVTTGGDVYRCQAVGFFDEGGPTARIEAVLDATQRPAAVVSWRDLSRLGRAYDLETLGAQTEP